ncbi:MAG: type II secretion system protein, partial [Kiritimatiellae bacterium]|nr:type II secretion system protein [Kiritimatiellia bacterium]
MNRRAFTMVEMLIAVLLVGVITTLALLTFKAVTRAWQGSAEYMDKMQRTDFALTQVISGLRSMYYPHDGGQDYKYGFVLTDNGDGEDPDDSDVIEWTKIGPAIVGNSQVADSVHRVQLMVLEEGDRDWKEPIEITGLYARMCPDFALLDQLKNKDNGETDYTLSNDELYQPLLIADGIVGFDCKVLPTADAASEETDERLFEDEFDTSNAVPYKVQLTFRIADPEGRAYRSNTAPVMRIVRIPIHEQSLDGAMTPEAEAATGERNRRDGTRGGARGGGNRGGGGAG